MKTGSNITIFNSEYSADVNQEFNGRFEIIDLSLSDDIEKAYRCIEFLQRLKRKFEEIEP